MKYHESSRAMIVIFDDSFYESLMLLIIIHWFIDYYVLLSYQRSNRLSFVEDMNGIFSNSSSNMKLRRLSTKSSVLGDSSENYLTQWKWYWKQEDNDWREYKSGVSVLFWMISQAYSGPCQTSKGETFSKISSGC